MGAWHWHSEAASATTQENSVAFIRVLFLKLLYRIRVGFRSATLISRKAKQQAPPEGRARDVHPGLRRQAVGAIQGQLLASKLPSVSEPLILRAQEPELRGHHSPQGL